MSSDCLSEIQITHVVFDAGIEALEGLSKDSKWKPGKYVEFVPESRMEEVLFNKVQLVAARCYKAAMDRCRTRSRSRNSSSSSRKNSHRSSRAGGKSRRARS